VQEYSPCRCEQVRNTGAINDSSTLRLGCDNKTLGDNRISQILKVFLLNSTVNTRSPADGSQLKSVHLEYAQLNHIPDELTQFNRLEKVYLSGNKIRSIASGVFNFKAPLKRLDLSWNGLSRIEPGAFQGNYGDGSWIILSNNNLTRLEAGVFQSVLERMAAFGGSPIAMIHIDNSILKFIFYHSIFYIFFDYYRPNRLHR
jgi:Leucine-rich repeat (LRR) protein